MHNTNEMVWTGTHIRSAPFSKAVYDTEATEVVIGSWNDVHSVQASAAEIGVYVDGAYLQSVNATTMGAASHTVTLPAGPKRVEIVINGYRGPANVALPSLIGPGIWLSSLEFNAPATVVPAPTKRGVVIVGDSIANGSKLASAIREAHPRLLQSGVDFPINVVGRGGLALHDVTVSLGEQSNFRPTKLVREVIAYNPQLVIFALGYNDAARNVWGSAALYAAAIDAVATEIAVFLPGVEMGAMTMLFTTNPQGNYALIKDAALMCTKAVGFVAPVLTSADLDVDGVHPNAAGHLKLATELAPYVSALAFPPRGEAVFTSNGSWVAPAGVTSVSLLLIGAGGNGISFAGTSSGGGGGALLYANNVSVTPGVAYPISMTTSASAMGFTAAGGTAGGSNLPSSGGAPSSSNGLPWTGFAGGAGASGFTGAKQGGGAGQYNATGASGSGQGTPARGAGDATGVVYGAGGTSQYSGTPTVGQSGVVRIIWGENRSYPNNAL